MNKNFLNIKDLTNLEIDENKRYKVDSKQLYITRIDTHDFIIYSYDKVIGIIDLRSSMAILTGYSQYSHTTSKHITTIKNRLKKYIEKVEIIYCDNYYYKNNELILNDLILYSYL